MSDIELVIRIPEEVKHKIDNATENNYKTFIWWFETTLYCAIKNGTQLPKGHGKIKDIDKIEWYGCTTEFDCPHKDRECKDCNRAQCSKTQVDAIPTIIEADKAESEEV